MAIPICSKVKTPVHAHSNATFDVENDEIFGPANALRRSDCMSKGNGLWGGAKHIQYDTKRYGNRVKKQEGSGSIT